MNVEIQKALSEDFGRVHELILEFARFQKTPDKVKISPEQMIKDKDIFNCLIARNETEIIGFATYFFSYHSWTGKAVYLDDLYVIPSFRGHGIGSQIFDRVMEIGKENHCYKMKWQVSGWNTKSQEFYRAKGAVIDDTEINCDLIL